MLHTLRRRAQEEKGFTLIELLVVILIIGILAAIALPAFLNQKEKGQDAEAKSGVRNMQVAEETYYTDNQKYTSTVADLTAIEPALSDLGARASITSADDKSFTIVVESKGANKVKYTIANNAGTITRTCAPTGKGACPSSGKW